MAAAQPHAFAGRAAQPRLQQRRAVVAAAQKQKVGFRYDPANLRWVRDDRKAGNAEDMARTIVTPNTGIPYKVWPAVHTELTAAGLKSVTPAEAAKLQASGWTLLDVRVAKDFEDQHAEGAVSVPMFRPVAGAGPWDNAKRFVMSVAFAMEATERNPDFTAEALQKLKKNQKVIVMCSIGGTLSTALNIRPDKRPNFQDVERQFGRESRSLKAAYELLQVGWSIGNIRHLEGGLQQWRFQKFPMSYKA